MLHKYILVAITLFFTPLIADSTPETLFSLLYHVENRLEQVDQQASTPPLDTYEVNILWTKALGNPLVLSAHTLIEEGDRYLTIKDLWNAKDCYYRAFINLFILWIQENGQDPQEALRLELYESNADTHEQELLLEAIQNPVSKASFNDFETNPYISSDARKKIRPYLLPNNHPMKAPLDEIFKATRATLNSTTFAEAGFLTLFSQPRSFIQVAKHPRLPGYLLKVNLDSELRRKSGVSAWEWFVRRCETAQNIKEIIKKKSLKYYVVPHKYLYPLPAQPSPPNDPQYSRKKVVLLVDDMHLVSSDENAQNWKTRITKKHLEELYTILSRTPGLTVRIDNITFTQSNKLAFIDTEFTKKRRNYEAIANNLSSEMHAYWKSLLKYGGK